MSFIVWIIFISLGQKSNLIRIKESENKDSCNIPPASVFRMNPPRRAPQKKSGQ